MQRLRDDIAGLSQTAHEELYKLVQKHGVRHSCNRNGVFFCMDPAQHPEFLAEMADFVHFCCANTSKLDEYERAMHSRKLGSHVYNKGRDATPKKQAEDAAAASAATSVPPEASDCVEDGASDTLQAAMEYGLEPEWTERLLALTAGLLQDARCDDRVRGASKAMGVMAGRKMALGTAFSSRTCADAATLLSEEHDRDPELF